MLAHEVAQLRELVFAQRTVFVLVEAIEESLRTRWPRRTIRTTGTTITRRSVWSAAFAARRSPSHDRREAHRPVHVRGRVALRDHVLRPAADHPVAVDLPDHVPDPAAGPTSKFSRSARPISRASARSILPSLFVSKLSSNFCFIAESPAGASSAGFSAGCGKCRPGQQAHAKQGDPTQPNTHDLPPKHCAAPDARGSNLDVSLNSWSASEADSHAGKNRLRVGLEHSAAAVDMSLNTPFNPVVSRGYRTIFRAWRTHG